jgi:hypothetical protein
MDINAERDLLIRELQKVEDISLLQSIKAVLHYGLQSEAKITVEQYNQELNDAETRIDEGSFVEHKDAV